MTLYGVKTYSDPSYTFSGVMTPNPMIYAPGSRRRVVNRHCSVSMEWPRPMTRLNAPASEKLLLDCTSSHFFRDDRRTSFQPQSESRPMWHISLTSENLMRTVVPSRSPV